MECSVFLGLAFLLGCGSTSPQGRPQEPTQLSQRGELFKTAAKLLLDVSETLNPDQYITGLSAEAPGAATIPHCEPLSADVENEGVEARILVGLEPAGQNLKLRAAQWNLARLRLKPDDEVLRAAVRAAERAWMDAVIDFRIQLPKAKAAGRLLENLAAIELRRGRCRTDEVQRAADTLEVGRNRRLKEILEDQLDRVKSLVSDPRIQALRESDEVFEKLLRSRVRSNSEGADIQDRADGIARKAASRELLSSRADLANVAEAAAKR